MKNAVHPSVGLEHSATKVLFPYQDKIEIFLKKTIGTNKSKKKKTYVLDYSKMKK